jgi:DME family drug/metabolite transporter
VFFVSVAAAAWGTGGVVAAVLYRTSGLGPVAVSFWRFGCGVAVLAVVCALRRPVAGPGPRWGRLAVTGVGMAVSQTAYFGAVGAVGATVGTVVTIGAGPVFIALGARATLGERLGARGAWAVGGALTGLLLLAGPGAVAGAVAGPGVVAGSRPALGVGLALLSAAGYAGVTLLGRAAGTGGDGGDPFRAALAGFGVGALCLLPLALAEGVVPRAAGLAGTTGWLLYLGVVPTALGYGLFFTGLAVVPATTASVVALVEPLTAAAIAVTLLGERLTVAGAAGGVLLLAAVALLARER